MKKVTKVTAATAIALSAVTPVAAFASESTLATGYYADTFTSLEAFKAMSSSQKKVFLLSNMEKPNFVYVYNGQVYDLTGNTGEKIMNASDDEVAKYAVTPAAYQTAKGVTISATGITKTPVSKEFSLKVTSTATSVKADGADNTVIKFELLGAGGKVDTNADNIVLEIGTTFGNLATNRVTVQDGVGQVVLSSEFSTKEVVAKINAQIIEASSDYKDLIGKVAGETTIKFSPSVVTTDPNNVTFQDAESNQADRVVLYFDKAVSSTTFVESSLPPIPVSTIIKSVFSSLKYSSIIK